MTTSHIAHTTTGTNAARRAQGVQSKNPDAITLLKSDHVKVKKMFSEFSKLEDRGEKERLAQQICIELTIHMTVEEELFYPAARQALEADDLFDEAEVEHASAKELIAQIQSGSPRDEKWDAKVTVLGEYINHHVSEEQNEIFPKVRKSNVDLKGLGRALMVRKDQLMTSLS